MSIIQPPAREQYTTHDAEAAEGFVKFHVAPEVLTNIVTPSDRNVIARKAPISGGLGRCGFGERFSGYGAEVIPNPRTSPGFRGGGVWHGASKDHLAPRNQPSGVRGTNPMNTQTQKHYSRGENLYRVAETQYGSPVYVSDSGDGYGDFTRFVGYIAPEYGEPLRYVFKSPEDCREEEPSRLPRLDVLRVSGGRFLAPLHSRLREPRGCAARDVLG